MGGWVWGPFKGFQPRLWPGSDAFPKQSPEHRAKADVYRLTCSRGPPAQDDFIGKLSGFHFTGPHREPLASLPGCAVWSASSN